LNAAVFATCLSWIKQEYAEPAPVSDEGVSMTIRRIAAAVGAVGLLVGGMAGPAQAVKPFAKTAPYADTDSRDANRCGLALHIESTFSGKLSVHPAPGSTEAFLAHDNYQFTDVVTLVGNPDGPFVTLTGNGNFREQHATLLDPNEPNIWAFDAIDVTAFRLYDSTGARIWQSTGVAKFTVVFNTRGDGMPGADFIEETAFVFHGPKTGDNCEALVAALT
jgi:hypothetical protein